MRRTVLRRAGVLALDWLYAGRHQLRAAFDRSNPDALVAGEGSRTPVVLIPGIFETWRFLRPLAQHIHASGHPVHVVTALEDNRMSVPEAAALVQRHLDEQDLTDVVIVAHSKGGLIAKYLMGMPDSGPRIRTTVAVATPFGGSSLARFIPISSVRALMPSSPGLVRLALNRAVNAQIISVWGWFDPHVPAGSRLEGARNIELDVGGHFRILARPELLAIVDEVLSPTAVADDRAAD
ncbi:MULTISPECIES: acetyltransferase and hydrolase with the alpha/beta hydrolase fold protein [Microbacteriaceae]|jgi:pimeloyl-ACP methyl ester carboxylesterase|uniref:esterase/lipase family protein n=1 Tax=Microbacteriaceae TaxID=85023 RepID=UPI0005846A32|nr:acetyltransferase and hydrolase with the alpha/beta hydrolase fold protein [Cryocola sp. 340MFSha3.1]